MKDKNMKTKTNLKAGARNELSSMNHNQTLVRA
jgi:hypothetical protein